MLNKRKTFALLCSIVLISACSNDEGKGISKWRYGQSTGWFPLNIDGEPIYANGMKAFINSSSMIVDCRGKAIKQGKLFTFLQNNNHLVLYNRATKNVDQSYPPEYVLTREYGKVNQYDYIHVDLTLKGSGLEAQEQCSQHGRQFTSIKDFKL